MLKKIFTILFICVSCYCQTSKLIDINTNLSFVNFINNQTKIIYNHDENDDDFNNIIQRANSSENYESELQENITNIIKKNIIESSNSYENYADLSKKFLELYGKCFSGEKVNVYSHSTTNEVFAYIAGELALAFLHNGKASEDIFQLRVAKAFFDSLPNNQSSSDCIVNYSDMAQLAIEDLLKIEPLVSISTESSINDKRNQTEENIESLKKIFPQKNQILSQKEKELSKKEESLSQKKEIFLKKEKALNLREQNFLQKNKEITVIKEQNYMYPTFIITLGTITVAFAMYHFINSLYR